MTELKRPESYVQFESIKPELKGITEFYTRKVKDYQYRLKQINEYADALENEISVLKGTPKIEVLLDDTPKPLVEVPQFVADWFENNEDDLSFKIWGYLINWKLQDKKSDFFKWMKKESECIEILIRMQDGYTVKKEQLYHVEFPKISEVYLNLRTDTGDVVTGNEDEFGLYKTKFTEQEIKAIDERYWAFAVEVDE